MFVFEFERITPNYQESLLGTSHQKRGPATPCHRFLCSHAENSLKVVYDFKWS